MTSTKQKFPFNEKHLSQIPALRQLINLGYRYLTPEQALAERGGRPANVLLENILREQLKKINRIHTKGDEHLFSEENIQHAIQKLKSIHYDAPRETDEEIYDLITLGTALEQTIDGDSKSFTLNYIDWKNPAANAFHVAAEFVVERARSEETVRPDIVLFVNGIPLVVIECKAPNIEVQQAISQTIRNQGMEYIPRLFAYAQLVLAVNKNDARYATAGSAKEFWSLWRELEDSDDAVNACINKALPDADQEALFSGEFAPAREHFEKLDSEGRQITPQDRCLYSLCRPQRLLKIVHDFIVIDSKHKKIARYQQFFLVRSAMKRIKQKDERGARKGGIVWHTQGSGKSITMVMLARALAMDPEVAEPRIILVTDRKDLDKQLGNTFAACGLARERATSGRNLIKHIRNKVDVITTIINKFDKALSAEEQVDDSPDIFVLVDESHRTNFGLLASRMRQMLPNACYIGFSGTPLLKQEKNSFAQFGGLIEPSYTVRQAVEDKVVVPLLYEGRHVELKQDQEAIDLWFDRHTRGLPDRQKAELKSKYSQARQLNQADQVVYERAFDISEHYRAHWQGSGFKAQLVADSKATALKYHEYLKQLGTVSSAVVISPPDVHEGHEDVNAAPVVVVRQFWRKMMAHHGTEATYNKYVIDRFKDRRHPQILIVVDKLITGFDAPRNTVLYLCRKLHEHTLLQAVARVNRLYEGKDFGYIIDYASVLEELDKALSAYDALAGFDEEDLADFLLSINAEVAKLPRRHSALWDLFKELGDSPDEDRYEVLLADEKLRDDFYERLREYAKTFAIALSSAQFVTRTGKEQLQRYEDTLRHLQKLKAAVQLRYAETEAADYRVYEPRLKKLLDTYIQADEASQIIAPVNIFDEYTFTMLKEKQGIYETKTTGSRADIIAHALRRRIEENMKQDPAFYRKFSELIQAAIDDFRQKRISDLEYLQKVGDIRNQLAGKQRADVPSELRDNADASAYFGAVKSCLKGMGLDSRIDEIATLTALAIQNALKEHHKVDFWNDENAQHAVVNDIDDFFYDVLKEQRGIDLPLEKIDEIALRVMKIAKSRAGS